MSRSELRTRAAWAAFDLWAWIIGILFALLALWGFNQSSKLAESGLASCCGTQVAKAPVAPAPAQTPAPTPAPAPAPAPAPTPAPPAAAPPASTVAPAVTPLPTPLPGPSVPTTPEPQQTAPIQCDQIMKGVYLNFVVDQADLTSEAKQKLDQVVPCLTAKRYEIAGHTDSDGSNAYNLALSRRRAQAVVTYLRSRGVPANKMVAVGYGETRPIADNRTADGKARNRRITFTAK